MHAEISDEIDAAIAATVERGDFILGAEVERFEARLRRLLRRRARGRRRLRHRAAADRRRSRSGSSPGAEVIVPAHTYIASALGPLHAGAVPVFCEVDEATGLIDPDAAAAAITERTAAIVAVHLYGQVCDPGPLRELADARGITLIEDAAQAHGASLRRPPRRLDRRRRRVLASTRRRTSAPSATAASSPPTTPRVADLARRWRNLGQLGKGDHDVPGMNERLDTLQAADPPRQAAAASTPGTSPAARPPRPTASASATAHPDPARARRRRETSTTCYPVLVAERDRVRAELADAGVGTGIHYTPAVHEQPPFAADHRPGAFPNAERWGRRGALAADVPRARRAVGGARLRRAAGGDGGGSMRQVARRLRDGRLELVEVPDPALAPGHGRGARRGLARLLRDRARDARRRPQGR